MLTIVGVPSNNTYSADPRQYRGTTSQAPHPSVIESLIQNLKEDSEWKGDTRVTREYTWITQLSYRDIPLNWVRCVEKKYDHEGNQRSKTVFEYVISYPVTAKTIRKIIAAGRLRQKIENEGFNTQNNLDYGLEHKYSRVSLQASKNYYQCLQIASADNGWVKAAGWIGLKFVTGFSTGLAWDALNR